MAKRRSNPTPPHSTTQDFDALFDSAPDGSPEKPFQRNAANARERARMRVLSRAFSRLKTALPWVPTDTKLSKLDTLRLASSYIAHLRTVLRNDVSDDVMKTNDVIGKRHRPPVHPITLTWPFTISNNKPGSGGEDSNTSVQNENKVLAEPHPMPYHSYPPCEYMHTTFTDEHMARDAYGHYIH
ncbi:hypothetical protein JTE90_005496 [Oedothorax gibbosus]|uniref:BHLH domain-containing protein n=1 Tax=Oedothorax gibbosus TaxID=931172 RepID=A0AAV6UTB0_9ARAC|nr:hypothetical protein JTE90_005496 [Oedothorax gibbosus]